MIVKLISQNFLIMVALTVAAILLGVVQMQVATTPRTITTEICGIEDGKLSCGETGTFTLTEARMKYFLDSTIRIECQITTIKYVDSTEIRCMDEK